MSSRILVVDDDAGVRVLFAELCESMGYSAHELERGEDALQLIRTAGDCFEAVIVDVFLDDMNGLDAVAAFKKMDPELSVVAVTGMPSLELIQQAISAGVDGFVLKPIDVGVFTTTLTKAVANTRNARFRVQRISQMEDMLEEYTSRMNENFSGTMEALIEGIEQKDPYTRNHSSSVSFLTGMIAEALRLPAREVRELQHVASLHDVGKIWVPEHILNKNGSLTDEEWVLMKKHPVTAAAVLSKIPYLKDRIPAIRHHHEHLNGRGYPDGLKGDDIPFSSCIISVADAFDAMTSDRSYRRRMPDEKAFKILKEERGNQFHPDCVDAFLRVSDQLPAVRNVA